jgi:putative chitinase
MPNAASAANASAMPDFGATLRKLWPRGNSRIAGLVETITATAPAVFDEYEITTPLLIAHVMAQISHECGAGTAVIENLNYSAGRMTQVWPSRFPNASSAAPYAHNPRCHKAAERRLRRAARSRGVAFEMEA